MIHICLNLINFWFAEFNLLLYYYYERIHIFVYLYYSIEFLPVRLEFCFTVNFYTIQNITLSRISRHVLSTLIYLCCKLNLK